MTSARLSSSGQHTGARSTENLIVSVLSALLPPGFRERQRGEWAGDLQMLADSAPATRRRYLWGAARTLPALRRLARRGSGGAVQLEPLSGVRQAAARVMALGLIWPMVSFAVWVVPRFYGADVAGRMQRSDELITSDQVWPLGHGPWWLIFLWWLPHYGAMLVGGGPLLFSLVGLTGAAIAWLRRRHRAVKGRALALIVAASLVIGIGMQLAAGAYQPNWEPIRPITVGLLGAVAILLGVTTAGLTRRERVGLGLLGLISLAAIGGFFTNPSMLGIWLLD